jgi:RNA polymerase sigma-70 factor, ECF subfamily
MDSKQIEQWYKTYGPMVFRRCRQLLCDEVSAKDAVQEVFVQVVRNSERIRVEFPSSFLYRIATNVSLNSIRSRKQRREVDRGDTLLAMIADEEDSTEAVSARMLLDKIFAREHVSTRVMATYHFVDGMTLEETARELNMSVSGVRKRLRHLKERFSAVTSPVGEERGFQ